MSHVSTPAVENTPEVSPSPLNQELIVEITGNNEDQGTASNQDHVDGLVEIKPIDPEAVNELREMFEAAVTSPVFMSKSTGIVALKSALIIRPSDDPAYNMCYGKAKDKLFVEAAMTAHKTKTLVILPTEDEITELATKNFEKNKEIKAKKATPSGTPIN